MLAASPRGFSLSTVMARGFAFEMLQDLVRAGLATSHRDAVGAGKTKVAHLRITAAASGQGLPCRLVSATAASPQHADITGETASVD
jgi:hypothetical protein